MKYGICIPHYGRALDVNSLTQMAKKAEDMGYDSLWVTDHIIVPHVIPGRDDIVYRYHMLEPLSLLTHLGAMTSRVSIGTSVVILPYRNPIVLAKMIATADVLSGGRVIFGAAVGWMEGEFEALNAPFADRGRVSDEYLQLLKELWSNPFPTFNGERFKISDVTFSPMPVQKPRPPIWIGGLSRSAIRRAVNHGDCWHPTQIAPKEMAQHVTFMRQYAEKVGRLQGPDLSWRGYLNLGSRFDNEDRPPLHGTIAEVVSDLDEFAALGVDHVVMEVYGETFDDKFRAMETFIMEVKPRVGT